MNHVNPNSRGGIRGRGRGERRGGRGGDAAGSNSEWTEVKGGRSKDAARDAVDRYYKDKKVYHNFKEGF